jgi:phytoene dehydrogenase-like protein
MPQPQYDALIIGSGHNGLVCGAYLAKAGLKVAVLERRSIIGGAAVTEEIYPGFRASIFSYLMSLLHPRIIADLDLASHGLEVLACSDMFSPLPDGGYITFSDSIERTQASFARFSRHDAEIYPAFARHLDEAAAIIRRLLWVTPPDPTKRDWRTFKQVAKLLWEHRRIGTRFYRVIDLVTMSADDYLKRWFEDSRVRAVLAYYASIGSFVGPKSPGSAYIIMHHIMGEHEGAGGWGFIKGGMGAITQAIASYGRTLGMDIITEADVARIHVTNGRQSRVETTDGRTFSARAVACNAHAKALYLDLLEAADVPGEVLKDVSNYRTFSTAFKINIACQRPPQYASLERALADGALGNFAYPTYAHIAPDIEYLERAYDDAKYGWYSARPFITPVVPSLVDDTLAPSGKHVVNLFGGHAPYKLEGAEWAAEKDNFKKCVFDVLDTFAPGFSSDVIHAQVLVPEDLEAMVGLPQGHIFHGELALEQLFFKRPIAHYADYRTPIAGLYLCGSSAHPGGGVSGIPGHNAAREILADLKRKAG